MMLFLQNKQEKYRKQAEMITDTPILHLSTSGCMGRLHPDVSAPDTRMYGNKTYQLID
jgi:hypothetical protein